jgi:hypothetical protein
MKARFKHIRVLQDGEAAWNFKVVSPESVGLVLEERHRGRYAQLVAAHGEYHVNHAASTEEVSPGQHPGGLGHERIGKLPGAMSYLSKEELEKEWDVVGRLVSSIKHRTIERCGSRANAHLRWNGVACPRGAVVLLFVMGFRRTLSRPASSRWSLRSRRAARPLWATMAPQPVLGLQRCFC